LLKAETDSAVEVLNAGGKGQVCLLCEHASARIPKAFDQLGLLPEQQLSHAVWDPGAEALALRLSAALDAPLILSQISRLVYDCNRPPEAESAIPACSELVQVPGNRGLTEQERLERANLVYYPFCRAVSEVLDARQSRAEATAVVTVHSFSPVFFNQPRATEIGVLHDCDARLADAMFSNSARLPDRVVHRNKPYGPEDGVTHSLKLHGVARDLPNVMLEVRNDLLQGDAGVERSAQELLSLLQPALDELFEGPKHA